MTEIQDILIQWYEGNGLLVKLIGVLVILILAFLINKIFVHIVDKALKTTVEIGENNRQVTLKRVLKSVVRYVIAFLALVMILSRLGINVVSIMAAAGVIGLAVSFGAQSLIKDVFAGFFIIFEDQYGVGEYVTINQCFTGVVELVGLRATRLRGDNGELIIVPNGTITDVVNFCRGYFRIKEVFEVSFDSDISKAEAVIRRTAKAYYNEHKDLFSAAPTVNGVDAIGESGVTLCLFAYVLPMEKWQISRDLKTNILQALQKEGIEIPFPVREVITKEK